MRYAEIEAALVEMHQVPKAALGTFRGRIRNFQRLGILRSSTGVGKKIVYHEGDAVMAALCFELSKLGLSPSTIKSVMDKTAGLVLWGVENSGEDQDFYLHMSGEFLNLGESDDEVAALTAETGGLSEVVAALEKCERLLVVNLLTMKRKLTRALGFDTYGAMLQNLSR